MMLSGDPVPFTLLALLLFGSPSTAQAGREGQPGPLSGALLPGQIQQGSTARSGSSDEPITQALLEEYAAEISGELERLRGQQFRRPVPVAVAGREQFFAYARRRLRRVGASAQLEHREVAAGLLGLVPPGLDLEATLLEVLEEQVSGYYDPELEAFWILEGLGRQKARLVLAHELSHALDDQLYDIDGALETLWGNADSLTAYRAVVEGSAMGTLTRWLREHPSVLDGVADMPGMETDAMRKAPQYVWMPLLCIYFRGPAFLIRSESSLRPQRVFPDPKDIARAFEDPPRSSEEILHPHKYWSERRRDAPRTLGFGMDRLPPGWEMLHQDTLGELGMALLATPHSARSGIDLADSMAPLKVRYTSAAAAGWGGDRYVLLGRGSARILVSVSRWDRPRDAREFHESMEALHPQLAEASLQRCIEVAPRGSSPGCLSGARVSEGEATAEVVILTWYGVQETEVELVLELLSWHEGVGEGGVLAMGQDD